MTSIAPPVAPVLDCDVHCALPSIEVLYPYLREYWPEFLTAAGYAGSHALSAAYPPGAPTTATPQVRQAADLLGNDITTLQHHVLDPWDHAMAALVCMTGFESSRNPYLSADLCRATNEWMRDTWLAEDDRFLGTLVVPTLDPDAAVEEIERVADDPRFVQILLPVRTETPYGNRRYHRLLAAAERHDLVLALHAWGSSGNAPGPSGFPEYYIEDYVINSEVIQSQIISLVTEGAFEKFPKLRVVLLECGFSWLPSLMWRLDKDWKGLRREVPWVVQRPSAYIRRQVRVSIQPAHAPKTVERLVKVLEMLPPELPVYASDYPHNHGDGSERLLASLDDRTRDAVLRTNANAFYGIREGA